MADGPDIALQGAVIAHLLADPDLSALIGGRVYDEPGQDAPLPYVRIGRIDVAPLRTDLGLDWDLMLSLEVHSRPLAGRVEAARIAGVLVAALDGCEAVVDVPGYPLEWCQFAAQDVRRAGDGRTYIATIAFAVSLSGLA